MNCEQAGQKMQELLEGEVPGRQREAILAHCEQCENCRSNYRKLLLLTAELKRWPLQKPGPAFNSTLMLKLEHETIKPVKMADLVLASAILMVPALAAFVLQLVTVGSFGLMILPGVDTISSLMPSLPVIDGLKLFMSVSYGYYTLRTQIMVFAIAIIALGLIGQAKPHKNVQ